MLRTSGNLFLALLLIELLPLPASNLAHAQDAQRLVAAAAQVQEGAQTADQQQAAVNEMLRAQQGEMNVQPRGSRRAGRGGRGRSSASVITAEELAALQSAQEQRADARSAPAINPTPAAESSTAAEPKDLIALNLWVLTIEVPKEKAAEDLTASLVARANDLPVAIGSRDDVRILVGKLTVAGVMARSREVRVMALNGQPVSIQAGGNQPQVIGGGRGAIAQVSYQTVGTNITFLPRVVSGGNVDVQLYLTSNEQHDAGNVPVGVGPDGNPVSASRTTNQQIQTTARVKSGAAALVQSDAVSEPNNEASSIRTQLIILGATIIPPLD